MSRTAVYSALVLHSRTSGQANSEVQLLTAEEGIIKATLFGGAKSKLRSHAAPYNSGQVWIYRDPAKNYSKLADFDVHSWRPGLRDLYERTMAAAAAAQTILSSHGGGGDWDTAMELSVETLDSLENAPEDMCARLSIHFLWRWADFLGIQPDLTSCSVCGTGNWDRVFYFFTGENSVLCANCCGRNEERAGFRETGVSLNPGCRRWLTAVKELDPSIIHRYSPDTKSFNEAKALTTAVMTSALGKRLACWDML